METEELVSHERASVAKGDGLPTQHSSREVSKARTRKFLLLTSFLISVTSIGIQFLPVIADRLEKHTTIPQWLLRLEASMVNRNVRGALTSNDLARMEDYVEAFKALPANAQTFFRTAVDFEQSVANIATLREEMDQLKRRLAEGNLVQERINARVTQAETLVLSQASDIIILRGSLDPRFEGVLEQLERIDQQFATKSDVSHVLGPINSKLIEMQNSIATTNSIDGRLRKVEQHTSELLHSRLSRNTVQLLLSRLLSAAHSIPIDGRDIDMLAHITAQDPFLAGKFSELKILAGMGIPPIFVLRDQFRALQPKLLDLARTEGQSSIGSAIASVRVTLQNWGLSSNRNPVLGELAIENANNALNQGDLSKALFELEVAPPKTRRLLAVWSNQAKLRVSMDRLFGELVNHMATQPEANLTQP